MVYESGKGSIDSVRADLDELTHEWVESVSMLSSNLLRIFCAV